MSFDEEIGEDLSNTGMRNHFGQDQNYGREDDDWADMEEINN